MDLYDVLLMRKFGGGGGKPSPSPSGGGEPKNVNFYDYEGTLLKSYTTSEWASVTELPANPTHEGLTAQGWNWDKTDIDDYISDYPEAIVNVGQMYITDDGSTRLYVHFEEGRTSPYLGLGVKGTVEIDWGDESVTDTLTGTNASTVKYIQHIYQPGDYIIKLTPIEDTKLELIGGTYGCCILTKSGVLQQNISIVYTSAIQKVELGINVRINNYAFYRCYSLKSITIPSNVSSIGNYTFNYCYSLKSIIIPVSITSISQYIFSNSSSLELVSVPSNISRIDTSAFGSCYSLKSITIPDKVTVIAVNAFQRCYSLKSITIPNNVPSVVNYICSQCSSLVSVIISNGVTQIGESAFADCISLASITIPSSVTNIGNNAFKYCYGMGEYHFLSVTPPTLSNSDVFGSISSDCIIYVPMESVDAYKTATNWSNYASQIQGE